MPIYEYVCKKCNNPFELLRLSRNGFKNVACPRCGSRKVAKELSTFAPAVAETSAACAEGACSIPSMSGCPAGMCGRD